MSIGWQIFVIAVSYILAFLSIRGLFGGIKRYLLNNSAEKKRNKGQTLKEWFLYSRYRKEIPKILLILYFTIVLFYPIVLIACLILYLIGDFNEISTILAKTSFYFFGTEAFVVAILFWSPGPGFAYERWIPRKGRNRKKKK